MRTKEFFPTALIVSDGAHGGGLMARIRLSYVDHLDDFITLSSSERDDGVRFLIDGRATDRAGLLAWFARQKDVRLLVDMDLDQSYRIVEARFTL